MFDICMHLLYEAEWQANQPGVPKVVVILITDDQQASLLIELTRVVKWVTYCSVTGAETQPVHDVCD